MDLYLRLKIFTSLGRFLKHKKEKYPCLAAQFGIGWVPFFPFKRAILALYRVRYCQIGNPFLNIIVIFFVV